MVYGVKYNTMTTDNPYQRYYLLCKQQDALRRKMSLQSPLFSPMSDSSSQYASFSSSPELGPSPSAGLPSLTTANLGSISTMATSAPISTMPGIAHRRNYSVDSNPADDRKELLGITMQIKASLTELLNEDRIKHDEKIRAEIQHQLMETEKQLKDQRRRRSSSVDKATADSIAGSFKFSL